MSQAARSESSATQTLRMIILILVVIPIAIICIPVGFLARGMWEGLKEGWNWGVEWTD